MRYEKSEKIYKEAVKLIPGGVNSPVRAFKSVEKESPVFIERGKGAKIYDEDGNEYIDYICSWGPLILGHNNERVLKGVREAVEKGSTFGLPTKMEVELAKLIIDSYPSIEMVRLTTSGTEATMAAVRVARAYTKRNKILKFDGCYHGHSDSLLVASGSGLLTDGYQDSNGITDGVLKDTLVVPFGDIEKVESLLKNKDIATVIMEPVPANMGLINSSKEFLQKVRDICSETGTVLIFDEVISGFRVSLGGAQEYYGITPDLTTLGKIVGGGYPVGAFGGKKEIMEMIAPVGNVYHAGTLSGNPIAVRAGYETLSYLIENRDTVYKDLENKVIYLTDEIKKIAVKYSIPIVINRLGSLFTIFFTEKKEIKCLEDVIETDSNRYTIYFNTLLDNGVMVPPSKYEAHFLSIEHKKEELEKTLECIDKAFKKMSELNER